MFCIRSVLEFTIPVTCFFRSIHMEHDANTIQLLSGTDMLGLYMATSHDRDSLTLRVDGQDIILGLYTPANGLGCTAGTDRPDIVDADGVIMVYDLLSRDDFEFAFAYCSDLQWDIRLEGPGLEIPIFLLGVNISDQKRSDSAMSEQEISEKARQLRAGHFKVNFGHPDQDAKALLPILEPFIGIAQGIRQAVKDYVEMRSHKYFMETHPFSLPTTADPNTVTGWSSFN